MNCAVVRLVVTIYVFFTAEHTGSDLKLMGTSLNLTVGYTMYPLHLNYTTTLPCKTITMKITIFTIVLVLKSYENVEM